MFISVSPERAGHSTWHRIGTRGGPHSSEQWKSDADVSSSKILPPT